MQIPSTGLMMFTLLENPGLSIQNPLFLWLEEILNSVSARLIHKIHQNPVNGGKVHICFIQTKQQIQSSMSKRIID